MRNRNLLMIPGPVEFEPAVLASLAEPTTSHLAPEFIEAFGQALTRLRQLVGSADGQPFVLAGTGTLAMDSAGANLVEAGDKALVVNTGYFSDRFGMILERYGAQVTHLRAPVGERPSLEALENALKLDQYKVVIATHVDTSTGVLVDVQRIAKLVRDSGAMLIVDGVCSVAAEALAMDEWGVDVVLTASQKAVGVPPGLALLVVNQRALQAFRARRTLVSSYYADWNNWLPIMEAYEARRPAYFATPAVNLIFALNVSLGQILAEGMPARTTRHESISQACKQGMEAMGLQQVPVKPQFAAHTMTAPRFPVGIKGTDFLANVSKAGVVLAGGLHPAIRTEYFRIGHMGSVHPGDILRTVGAVEGALIELGHPIEPGSGVAAAQQVFSTCPSQG